MSMATYLSDDLITLRAPEPEDLEMMYRIENDTELWSVGNATVPYSRYALKQYIATTTNDLFTDKQARFMIMLNDNHVVCGMIDLCNFDPMNNRAEISLVILPEQRKKGLARKAVEVLCSYAFGYLHLHQLYIVVPADHPATCSPFLHNAFVQSATLPQWLLTENGYADAILMQRINE